MTIRKKIEETLFNYGLWEDEAKIIVAEAEQEKVLEMMRGRWDSDVSAYPSSLLAVVLISVKHYAVEWLKKNKPEHFALAILTAQP